jgi:hypothetical protein
MFPSRHDARVTAMEKIRIEQHSSIGLLWAAGWLFTIGYLGLGFWQGVLALIVWPYFLGVHFTPIPG